MVADEAFVGEVALGIEHPAAKAAEVLGLRLDVDHRHRTAGREDAARHRLSHATGRARHHGGAAGEVVLQHHQPVADIAFSAAAIAA